MEVMVDEGCTECTYIEIPQPIQGPELVLPRSPTSDEPDLTCRAIPIGISSLGNGDCIPLSTPGDECNGFVDSIFAGKISVCRNASHYLLCLSSMTRKTNNTKLNFHITHSSLCQETPPTTSSLYIGSYKLTVRGK